MLVLYMSSAIKFGFNTNKFTQAPYPFTDPFTEPSRTFTDSGFLNNMFYPNLPKICPSITQTILGSSNMGSVTN